MSQNLPKRSLISTLLAATILAGCSSQPRTPVEQPLPVVEFEGQLTPDELLTKASRAAFPKSAELKLEAAEQLIDEQMVRAQNILNSITYEALPASLKARMALAKARIAEQTGQNWEIFYWLDREPVIVSSDRQLQTRAHTIKARAYNRYGEYVAALDEWLSVFSYTPLDKQPELNEDFWKTLLNVSGERLLSLSSQTTDQNLKAWLELAMIYQPGHTLVQQLKNLQAWQTRWQNHAAASFLPNNIDQLQSSALQQPEKIALLLPISGPLSRAGRAVRDGFMAAYYESISSSAEGAPELIILDTYQQDIRSLAKQAVDQGAELLIGPLDKSKVQTLKASSPANITILALNNLEHDTPGALESDTDNFFEFGLSTEDEARMVARRGILDGHRRALVLRPDSSWGQRASSSFREEWQRLGGEIAGETQFNDQSEFSSLAGKALLVDKSQQRAKQIGRLLREKVGFEPRRRQDVDMIYIPSNPKEARQLKPALSYQFAGNIPVYATSSAYSGRADTSRDQDLDNLRIPVMPWSLPGTTTSLEKTITSTWSSARGQYGSLYAMGADAFSLYPRLHQLNSLTGSRIEGLTGWLSINDKHHIERELSWQVFRNGRLTALPIPVQQQPDVLATDTLE